MSHGHWCNSKTIPMTCKFCGQNIFYFSCDCGCKVFFDDLGDDWPRHDCNGHYKETKNETKSFKTILIPSEKVSWTLITADDIDEQYKNKIRKNKAFLYNSTVPILFIEAKKDKIVTISGIIKEVISYIDLFKIFKIYKDNVIGSNLLKQFKNEKYQQITIHTINLEDNKKDSYTTLISNKIMKMKNIQINDNVIIKISGVKILDINKWNCLNIEKLDDLL